MAQKRGGVCWMGRDGGREAVDVGHVRHLFRYCGRRVGARRELGTVWGSFRLGIVPISVQQRSARWKRFIWDWERGWVLRCGA